MYKKINRMQMMEMMNSTDRHMTLMDVLPAEHFMHEHIKGAMSMPCDSIDEMHCRGFDKAEDVVVYCASSQCNASEMAAEKLDQLGFTHVYDYAAGLEDYKAAHMPIEGE